jgi:hypothetical protein
MLRDFWNRHIRRARVSTVEHEAEREQMSPDERRFDEESIDDLKAENLVNERLGEVQTGKTSDEGESVT